MLLAWLCLLGRRRVCMACFRKACQICGHELGYLVHFCFLEFFIYSLTGSMAYLFLILSYCMYFTSHFSSFFGTK